MALHTIMMPQFRLFALLTKVSETATAITPAFGYPVDQITHAKEKFLFLGTIVQYIW